MIKRLLLHSVLLSIFTVSGFAQMSYRKDQLTDFEQSEILRKANKSKIPWIENKGQVNEKVAFYANTFAGTAFVTNKGEIVYNLPVDNVSSYAIKETFCTGNNKIGKLKADGTHPSQVKVNYFNGGSSFNWQSNVPTCQTVELGEVWDGIDVKLNAYGSNIEKLFYVEPGINPDVIQVKVEGTNKLNIAKSGELIIETPHGNLELTAPIAYQVINGKKQNVKVSYKKNKNTYGFKLGAYHPDYTLVIDPLIASTYLGGSSGDEVRCVQVDSYGYIYISGYTSSTNYPVVGTPFSNSYNGGATDFFISKLSSDLSTLVASTFLGGSGYDIGSKMVLDDQANIYMIGYTNSTDFPTVGTPFNDTYGGGSYDGVVVKISSDLSTLMASTYIGGTGSDYVSGVLINNDGDIVFTGTSSSTDYPMAGTPYNNTLAGGSDVIVTKMTSDLSSVLSSTYIGGTNDDSGNAIAEDNLGNIYISGHLLSTNYPTSALAYDATSSAGTTRDAFVSKLDSDLSSLLASTYIGGSAEERCYSLTLDGSNNVFISGSTKSSNFPTSATAYDNMFAGGNEDIYISKFDSDLSNLLASTYLGGNDYDYNNAPILIDTDGNVIIEAMTDNRYSVHYPSTSGAYDETPNSDEFDIAISKFDNDLSTLIASTFVSGTGSGREYDYGCTFDNLGDIVFVGTTNSSNFPMPGSPYDNSSNGAYDAFVSKISPDLSGLPYIYTNPANKDICPGSDTYFSVLATADSYQWQVDEGSGFVDITDGGIYSGATTDTLMITGATVSENGFQYQCITTNAIGNKTSEIATLAVADDLAPVADVASLPDVTGECSATVTAPTATDNCAGSITATTSDPLSYSSQGTYTINWTYDDGNGNTSTQTQTVIVDDVTAPVADVASLPDVTAECSATVTAPTATDNCAGSITATTSDPLSYSSQGTYTVNWTYDDGNGNTSTQTQTVIVDDITAPVADVASLPDVTAECSATVTAPTATDNCAGSITATTSDPLSYSSQGTYTVNWTYDDGNGNTSTQTQTVIVDDITAPLADVASLPDVTGECSATVTAPTATDNCAGSITATTSDPLSYSSQGTYTVNWTYDDGNGNTSTQTQTVIVDDITAPLADVASLPDVTGECSATVTAPTATDNCAGSITATTSDPLSYSSQGTYTVNWTYDDGNGNTSTQTQTVIVDDVTAPLADVASLPDVTGECSATVTAPTATDNCAGSITATTSDPLSYSSQGTYTVNWTYDDGNGNTSTQTQNVVIEDNTNPIITCVADLEIEVTGNTYTVQGTEFDPESTFDNCGIASISNDFNSTETLEGAELPLGTNSITWTITDIAGNTTSCTVQITISMGTGMETLSEHKMMVYPNPAKDYVLIKGLENETTDITISIHNLNGKLVYQNKLNGGRRTDVSGLKPGVYFIKIQDIHKVNTLRFIKSD